MEKGTIKIRFASGVAALVLATGYILLAPIDAYADKALQQGKFIAYTQEEEDDHFNKYVVKEGDTTSRISEKVCRFFKQEKSTKFWPTIAFLNDFPRVIQPGDIIVFPETYEDMVSLNKRLRELNWTSRYIQNNDIYGRRRITENGSSLADLLKDIYGNKVRIDEDFIRLYLDAVGQYNLYDRYNGKYDKSDLYNLTEWIPTLDELKEFRIEHSGKTKTK